ncbi:MAG: hypothetical protein WAU68_01980 [Vitreimonas sp.]
MSEPPTPKVERTAPLILWRVAQSFLHTLHALFGGPERIAFQHTLTQEPYRLLLSWIRCGEAMMRRLLLIEAAAYPKPNTPPRLWPKRTRVRRLVGFDDDKPETWRVSFRCFSSGPPASSRQKKCRQDAGGPKRAEDYPSPIGDMHFHQGPWFTAKPAKFYSAWPLAERYEALLRVFNSPEPYARRLAKRLHALTHRLRELLRAPPEAERRIERFEALTHAAEIPWRIPNSS